MGSMLPILDLTDADGDPTSFRTRLREAAHDSGFFYLVGHGVPREQCDEVLTLARQFFALPAEAKNEISQLKSPQFRGYSRIGGELTNGKVDWREQIDIGPERPVIDGAEGYWRLQGPICGRRRHQVFVRRSRSGTLRCRSSGFDCCATGRCRWVRPRTRSIRRSPTDRPP